MNTLIWLDIETTGLDSNRDEILEIGLIATNPDLEELTSFQRVFFHKPTVEYMMAGVVKEMHTKNGLLSELKSGRSFKEVVYEIGQWLDEVKSVEYPLKNNDAKPVLAGSSVHFDRAFIRKYMPEIDARFHHRHIDVSTVKELCKRWRPDLQLERTGDPAHRVLADLHESIRELKFYKEHFLKSMIPFGAVGEGAGL